MSARTSNLDRILGRLDDLDSNSLTVLVQRLVRERSLLTTVINSIREGLLLISENGLIEYANAAGRSLIGLKEDDIGKAILWKYVPELSHTIHHDMNFSGATAPTISRELEIAYPERRIVRIYMTPIATTEDNRYNRQFILLLTDITQDKLTVEERVENEKISSIMMLAAGVAHELGNPLNSINIHLQLIRRQLAKLENESASEKIDKAVKVCSGEVERLDGIIKNFLEAIRPSPPNLIEINLLDILEEVLEFLSQEIKNSGIGTEVILGDKLPSINADRDQIKQVFFNVSKNSIQAMEPGGELKITARADGDYVYIYFADTGKGIDPESMARLFQPYFTTKLGGHGLGMMICQRIMRDHGGQIGVDSREGKGTIVTLQFPRRTRRLKMLASEIGDC